MVVAGHRLSEDHFVSLRSARFVDVVGYFAAAKPNALRSRTAKPFASLRAGCTIQRQRVFDNLNPSVHCPRFTSAAQNLSDLCIYSGWLAARIASMRFAPFYLVAASSLSCVCAFGQNGRGHLTVNVDQPGVKISPMFYGMMTEEINHAYDGGLYAELIRNRVFKDSSEPVHWSVEGPGTIEIDEMNPVPGTALTRSLKVRGTESGSGVTVVNDGYWGVPPQAENHLYGQLLRQERCHHPVPRAGGDRSGGPGQ